MGRVPMFGDICVFIYDIDLETVYKIYCTSRHWTARAGLDSDVMRMH